MKVALIVDSLTLSEDMQAVIDGARCSGAYEIAGIILIDKTNWRRRVDLDFSFSSTGWVATRERVRTWVLWLIYRLERRLDRSSDRQHGGGATVTEDIPIIRLTPIFSRCGRAIRVREDDLGALRGFSADVFVRGTSLFLLGAILTHSKFGVIGVHHGDHQRFRGRPSGFWECVEGNSVTNYIIQGLGPILDRGRIYHLGQIKTEMTILRNTLAVQAVSRVALVEFLVELSRSGVLPCPIGSDDAISPVRRVPTVLVTLRYFITSIKQRILNFLK
jgi:hypothetical protein